MTIVNRLSMFFLIWLGIILVGFSAMVFGIEWYYLYRQADAQSISAFHALVAAIEVHPDDVEWEPNERKIVLGQGSGFDQVRWSVHDNLGELVDYSDNLLIKDSWNTGAPWSVGVQIIRAGNFIPEIVVTNKLTTFPNLHQEMSLEIEGRPTFTRKPFYQSPSFTLSVAVSHQPIVSSLWLTAKILLTAGFGVWVLGALFARLICKQALIPVTIMSASGKSLGSDPSSRLSVPKTGDELEGLGHTFNDLLARLQIAFDRQSRFSADAAHQLRTPLAALLGQVEVALKQERPAHEYLRVLNLAKKRGLQLKQIIESLLFLARPDEVAAFEMKQVEITSWIQEWINGWSDHERFQDLLFDSNNTSPCLVNIHVGLFNQIMDNILDNACKYSTPGSAITIKTNLHEARLQLTIEDHGCGIETAELQNLGEPFFRTEEVRRLGIPGIGLGLAIAKRATAAIGADVTFESKRDVGTKVTISIAVISELPEVFKNENSLTKEECHEAV
ncbi:MAG: HAMP domain-containing sensor histidine kinase [Planctomycetota bacterium]|nr:HAMP domain-containing sensor histidine kinase [Planctomycetota bacterium]